MRLKVVLSLIINGLTTVIRKSYTSSRDGFRCIILCYFAVVSTWLKSVEKRLPILFYPSDSNLCAIAKASSFEDVIIKG